MGLALSLALGTSGNNSLRRTLRFQERDWVLLEGFENRTGDLSGNVSEREPEAHKIDDPLRKLLAVADPDHPILRQLNGR